MNDIGLVLTADARAMIKALKDAEGSLKTFSVKTEADLARMQKAAQETDKALSSMGQGLSTSQVNKGLLDLNRNLTATGQTAKQTAAALRGVPAQITDIVVSLQGGQNPMTVFLQQGGIHQPQVQQQSNCKGEQNMRDLGSSSRGNPEVFNHSFIIYSSGAFL